jgi:hypothetical protein
MVAAFKPNQWHTVANGETMLLIAKQAGFKNWHTLYDHPQNAEFRRSNPDPVSIRVGDRLWIPEKTPSPGFVCGTARKNRFVVKVLEFEPRDLLPKAIENPGEVCIQQLAAKVSEAMSLRITLGSQRDSALTWQCASIHPLQPLENIHQSMVHIVGRAVQDNDERQEKEQAKLGEYFAFASVSPQLLKTGAADTDASQEFPEEQLLEAKKTLSKILQELKNEVSKTSENGLTNGNLPEGKLNFIKSKLKDIVNVLDRIQQLFPHGNTNIPALTEAQIYLQNQTQKIDNAKTWEELRSLCYEHLQPAIQSLNRTVNGLARVQMFYNIEPFYLFRLLVPFQVESNQEISDDIRTRASGELTGLLNNKREWLIQWLQAKLKELDQTLQNEFRGKPDHLFFHLKGGRALASLKRHPEEGENDWDTSIVINPYLPADEWYATFNQVHNLVLHKLKQFKREFFVLIHQNAPEVLASLQPDAALETKAVPDEKIDEGENNYLEAELHEANLQIENEALLDMENNNRPFTASGTDDDFAFLFPSYTGNCKAELIDIGIPRRDTVEAFEQWNHTRGRILRDRDDQIPIPSHLYYIDEYILMIRQALTGTSPSMPKTPKRIRRLFDILDMQDDALKQAIAQERSHLDGSLFSKSLSVIDRQVTPLKNVLITILKQFTEAYDLTKVGLTAAFDTYFATESQHLQQLDLPKILQEAIQKDEKFKLDSHGVLLNWITLANNISAQFEKHFQTKASFWGFGALNDAAKTRRKALETFIKEVYAASIFSAEAELEVQFAITGSYAAYLHADYLKVSDKLQQELDPVNVVEIKLFCYNPKTDPITVREALLTPAIAAYFDRPNSVKFDKQEGADGSVLLYWPQAEEIAPFKYKPLAIKIEIVSDEGWPQLAFIWGFPVISLRDLIRQYDRKAAEIEEYEAKQRLKKTSSLLKEMLTQYEQVK